MCKKSLLMMLLLALLVPWAAKAQSVPYEVQIGEGESTTGYFPFYTLYNYSIAENLFLASELTEAGVLPGQVTSLSWYATNAPGYEQQGISIWMANVDDEELTTTSHVTTDMTLVYTGSVTPAVGWNEFMCEENTFTWDGTSNILVFCQRNNGDWNSTVNWQATTGLDFNAMSYRYQDSGAYDVTVPNTMYTSTTRPNIIIKGVGGGGGGPSCARPTGLAINYTGGTTAEVSWNSDATAWNIDVNGTVTAITTNPYTLTNLELGTAYTVKVQANCGGGDLSDWSSAKSFTTDLCLPENMCELTFELTDSYGDGWNGGKLEVVDALTNVVLGTFTLTNGDQGTFTLAVCDGRDINFVYTAGSYPTENGWVVTDINDEVICEHEGCNSGCNPTPGVQATYTVNCTPAACPKPTGLMVKYEGGTEAIVAWTSDATAWNMRVNGTPINGTITNPYTLTGLELSTTYEVEVQANCGSDLSEWATTSFTTDACMPEDMIAVNYALTDSYGDGWNGNAILVVDENCNIVNQLTIASGNSASGTLRFCSSYVQFLWYKGNYPHETSWVFTDNAGNVLFEGAGSASMATLDVLYTIDNNPYSAPTDVTASEVGPRSAKLSWTETGTATAWQIKLTAGNDDEGTIIDANSNPFVITGLTPETEYIAQVRAIGTNGTSIWTCVGADFTTIEACPAPTDLTVTPYPFSANMAWNGLGEAYNIEWAEYVAPTSSAWLQYDDGSMQTNVGSSSADEFIWGVMYPAEMLNDNVLTKVAFYEVANSYYTDGTITLNVYSGGDTAPETLLGTETVATEGTNGMREVVLSCPIEFNPEKNLWITLTTNATYCLSMSAHDGGINSRWFFNGSNWVDFGTLFSSGATYSFMIRGFVETNDYSSWGWTTESGVTSPFTITGLEPETDYAVRVKADCGADGESGWIWTYFTTPSACDAPIELTVTDTTYNSATLNWTGYQNSFNVRYRTATKYVPVWEDDFENGLDKWTVVAGAEATYPSGGIWYIINPVTGLEFEAHGGTYCTSSWSWNTDIAYDADNWLITPQLDLQGVLRYYVRTNSGYPDSYEVLLSTTDNETTSFTVTLKEMAAAPNNGEWNEVIIDLSAYAGQQGYIAIHHVDYDMNYLVIDDFGIYTIEDPSAWISATTTEPTLALTGLTPETEYEWQVQGINNKCEGGLTEWSEIQSFTTLEESSTVTQTIVLIGGQWNWFSTYIEGDPVELLDMLKAGLGDNATEIQSTDDNTEFDGEEWFGGLDDTGISPDQTYWIYAENDCTVKLVGKAANAADYTITLLPGAWTWIGFPSAEEIDIATALSEFEPEEEDAIQTSDEMTEFDGAEWFGDFETLVPGTGYMYFSNSDVEKDLVFKTRAKVRRAAVTPGEAKAKKVKVSVYDVDLFIKR